ncbi:MULTISPECIES: serine hydrolase [unclassified Streptomyces]|uniref:D-alanyl-D-alanine carboxypeptidase family protein n=1 Tax=unclassified Streptomyces TaxID=2593676 RepID=UPI0006FBB868|nr:MULTISPECIES: serine hydrolase [unclassified Streptomyces]KQX49865.1 D-alanyl-D-alanine carboxypeptidase [Streptomyces sp. Root1304]KRA80092.1 D-alanyl-D-alanine carboxypeptidase [Streptomyces sp. Root66D1]
MIVTSAVRHAAAGSAALLFVLPVPAAAASSVTPASSVTSASSVGEPTPPARQHVDPARLDRKGTQVQPLPGAPAVPSVSALSWVVADASSGEVLAARDAHRKLPPASTLKTLFALTALPHHEPSERHTVADAELTGIGDGSSLVGVKEGYTYKVSDLWNGVFLSSGNDAVHVLASMNGGWESMTRQMQEKARSLGAHDTHVVSPDGYDAPGQVSSAYDLALFGRTGLQDPAFTRYCSTPYADFPAGTWSYGIANTNRLLTGADGVARYPGLLGIKNGYTSNAGNTLVSAARRDGRTLVVSVMNPQDGGGFTVYEEARELLDWGFASAGRVRPVGSLLPERVKAAAEAGTRAVSVTRDGGGGADGSTPRAGAVAAADGEEPSGASAGLPLALVGSACAAALALWGLRRRAARRAG